MLEQAAQRQCGGADSGLQPDRVKVVGLPAEGCAEPVEGTDEVLGLGAGQRRFPPAVSVGHAGRVDRIANVLRRNP